MTQVADPTTVDLEQYRSELTGFCYRMLGSAFDADDAVQETMVRAWRGMDTFEGRSAVRSWLYRIATNVCLDMLRGRQRRARPMEMGPSSTADSFHGETLPEHAWVTPIPDTRVLADDGDPAELAAERETIRLAFVAALQRARANLAEHDPGTASADAMDPAQQALLARYVEAFENYDVTGLVRLLHDDVVQSMPPYAMWLQGPDEISQWLLGPGIGCRGSRLMATAANGGTAFGQYRPDPQGGHAPWSLQVIEMSGGRIIGLHNFLDTKLFAAFGLPAHL